MDYNEYLTRIICKSLGDGSNLVLATIISQEGSAPQHTGTRMVIGADGNSLRARQMKACSRLCDYI